jgi:hypothetical protein
MACSTVVSRRLLGFYNQVPTTIHDEPTSVPLPPDDLEESISALRQFSPEATAMFMDLTEARSLVRTEVTVKTHNGGQVLT